MRRTSIALISFATAALLAGAAQARCAIGEFSAIATSVTYDPFDVQSLAAPISIRATSSGDCRSARVQLALMSTPESARTGPIVYLSATSNLLQASVLDAGGGVRPVAATATAAFVSPPPFLPLGAQGIQSSGASLRLAVTPGQAVPPGTYIAHLLMVARVTDEKGSVVESETPLDISVSVKPSVRLAAGGGDLLIDLGELKPNVVGPVAVKFDAYANLDYELTVRSANGFTLERAGHTSGGPAYTPVLLPAAAAETSDGANVRRLAFPAPSGEGRRSHSFNVRVYAFDHEAAGAYADEVTLEIRARL